MELRNNKEETEIWSSVPNFPNYEVSSFGRLRRIKKSWSQLPGPLTPFTVTNGYKQFQFHNNGAKKALRIHTIVLEVFDREKIGIEEANHKDGDTSNNNINNLEWVTPSQNMKHAYDTKLHPKPYGDKSHFSKLTPSQVNEIRVKICDGLMSMISIAKEYSVSRYCIYRIRDGKSWRQ